MSLGSIPLWNDRQFKFDLPVEFYPNVLARVRGTPARLEDAVSGLTAAKLKYREGDKFSIQENAGHLLDVEDLFEKRLEEFQVGASALTAAGYRNPDRVRIPYHDQMIASILRDFRVIRTRQAETLSRLKADDFARSAWHPRLQSQMRLVDHLLFMAEHDDHHLARIWQLRSLV